MFAALAGGYGVPDRGGIMTPTPDLGALNRIRAGRIDDFERWLREVVFPAAPTDADGR